MGMKIFKNSYISFTFKLNEKKKYLLEKMNWKKGLQENVCWREFWCLIGSWKHIRKEGLTRKELRKMEGCLTHEETML